MNSTELEAHNEELHTEAMRALVAYYVLHAIGAVDYALDGEDGEGPCCEVSAVGDVMVRMGFIANAHDGSPAVFKAFVMVGRCIGMYHSVERIHAAAVAVLGAHPLWKDAMANGTGHKLAENFIGDSLDYDLESIPGLDWDKPVEVDGYIHEAPELVQ